MLNFPRLTGTLYAVVYYGTWVCKGYRIGTGAVLSIVMSPVESVPIMILFIIALVITIRIMYGYFSFPCK